MATEFKLPKLGEGAETGTVTSVLVSEGDAIDVEQAVIELETDKATVEVPSSVKGTVKEVKVSEGDEVREGSVLLIVEEEVEEAEKEEAEGESEPAKDEPKGKKDSKDDGRKTKDKKKRKEVPEKEEKSEDERTAKPPEQAEKTDGEEPAQEEEEEKPQTAGELVPAAPSVRRFARELGVDISRVKGSEPGGRISVQDVKAHANRIIASAGAASSEPPSAPALPDFSKWGPVRRESMMPIRRRAAQRLSTAWSRVPHVTQFDRADITELEDERKRLAPAVERSGGKLTLTVILAKVAAAVLEDFPRFNASVDMDNREIIYKDYRHIGIAVDTENGLMVPVVKNADEKSVARIASEIGDLAEAARSGKIRPEDLHGGTFTLTNLGGIGGTHFSPIVNYPEVAVLGLGRAYREPRLVENEVRAGLTLPLSLSYDHRVIDGAAGARFLRRIVEFLETPLLLGLRE